jgi:hypothetical protein
VIEMPKYPKAKVEKLLKLADFIDKCADMLRAQAMTKRVSESEEKIVKKRLMDFLKDSADFVKFELEKDETNTNYVLGQRINTLLIKEGSKYAEKTQEALGDT